MPQMIELHYARDRRARSLGEHDVATEEELLAFANKMRDAGDADPLESLLPSVPHQSNACLIANALNFSSTVDSLSYDDDGQWVGSREVPGLLPDSGVHLWGMRLPNMERERAQRIADAVECSLIEVNADEVGSVGYKYIIKLPVEIGLAAHAFDEGAAFTEYQKR